MDQNFGVSYSKQRSEGIKEGVSQDENVNETVAQTKEKLIGGLVHVSIRT